MHKEKMPKRTKNGKKEREIICAQSIWSGCTPVQEKPQVNSLLQDALPFLSLQVISPVRLPPAWIQLGAHCLLRSLTSPFRQSTFIYELFHCPSSPWDSSLFLVGTFNLLEGPTSRSLLIAFCRNRFHCKYLSASCFFPHLKTLGRSYCANLNSWSLDWTFSAPHPWLKKTL